MPSEPKKGIGVLAMFGKPKPAAPRADTSDPKTNAAKGVLEAINDNDAGALASALSTFIDAASEPEENPDESTSGLTA